MDMGRVIMGLAPILTTAIGLHIAVHRSLCSAGRMLFLNPAIEAGLLTRLTPVQVVTTVVDTVVMVPAVAVRVGPGKLALTM